MLLLSQTSEFKPITERFCGSTRFIHFDGVRTTIIHSRRNQTQLFKIMANVVYRNVVADFCSREGISCRVSLIPGIVVLFYMSPLLYP